MSRKNDQFKAKDKKTHKMSRDGLVEVNQTEGTEQRVSQRGQEFELKRQTPAGQETPTAPGFGESTGRRHRQASPPTAEPSQSVGLQDTTAQRQGNAEHGYSPDTDARQPDTAATVGGHSQAVPVQADAPLRAASHAGNVQTAATVAATHSSKRHKLKQSQAAIHQEQPVHGSESAQNSAAQDTAPRAAERPSRLQFGESEQPSKGRGSGAQQHGTGYQRKFDAESVKQNAAAPAEDTTGAHSDKLKFAADEKPPEALGDKLTDSRRKATRPDTGDPRLDKALHKTDKVDGKLGKAREKLPTKRRASVERVYDEKKDKTVRKLHFEKEVKSQSAHLKGALPLRPVKMGANAAIGYGHKKLYQVEHENVGTQAAHKGEIAAEGMARSAYRFHKTRPYRRVARLERAATKQHIKLDYAKALHDNPKLKSNPFSRFMQKQKIKRQYAKAARDAKKAASRVKQAGDALSRAFGAVVGFVRRHPMLVAGIALLLLMLVAIMSMFSSCSNIAGGGFSAIFMSSYTAEDKDINDAELAYTQWETGLLLQVENAETDRPGYDEYRYNVADVSHDPFELMAYLTAKYQNFTYTQVEADLRAIFAEQYTLTFTEEIEVRYRTEYYYDDDGELQSEEVPYNWYILHVNLTARSFSDVVSSRLSADERELFNLYMETKGNRQYTLSPFDFDWLPYVSCYFGYRIHPITGAEDYHKAVDIAVASGTEILATHDGVVTTATWHDSYGWYVAIETTTDTGKTLVTKYAHCSTLLVSAGQTVSKGDVIAKVGSTGDSTGPHLHFEVIVDGEYLNPLFFSEGAIGGTAAPGTPGGPDYPEYPGAPMGDGTYAALMEEAQKHLGKSYVFGAKGPNTFDCSGFVCWSLTHSGVKSIQTNAQGLYNACTPVSPENAQPGDLIFFEGTYSTSNRVTHVGIYIGNGQMIHAGNPVQYASINTSYWQSHFYSFGRL